MRHVIFFGNPLHGDDGFGPAVFERMKQCALPSDVRLFDAGTCGLNALALFDNCTEAIVVDAMAPGAHPGRITQPAATEILEESALPGHAAGVGFLLKALAALSPREAPLQRFLTVEAQSIAAFSPGLSPAVQAAVEPAFDLICKMLDVQIGTEHA